MQDIGFVLTVIWLLVLFGGAAVVVKSKSKNAQLLLIATLALIPTGYILVWLFSQQKVIRT